LGEISAFVFFIIFVFILGFFLGQEKKIKMILQGNYKFPSPSFLFLLFSILTITINTHKHNNFLVLAQEVGVTSTGTYSPGLNVFADFPDVRPNDDNALTILTSAFHMHLYTKLPDPDAYVTFPVLAAPLCFAINTTRGLVDIHLSLQQLSDWLTGAVFNQTISSPLETTKTVTSADVQVFLVASSPVTSIILQTMKNRGVPGWSNGAVLPSSVLSNPNITFVASDKEVAAFLKNTSNSVGFVSLGVGAGLQCADFLLPNDVDKTMVAVSARLPQRIFTQLVVDPAAATLYSTGTAYPFVGPALLSVRKASTCLLTRYTKVFDFVVSLFGDSSLYAAVAPFGFGEVSPADRVAVLRTVYNQLPCVGYDRVVTGGSSTTQSAIADWILNYVWKNKIFIDYTFDGSANGLETVRQQTRVLATSEVVYTSTQTGSCLSRRN
jgi:hypothetical protein